MPESVPAVPQRGRRWPPQVASAIVTVLRVALAELNPTVGDQRERGHDSQHVTDRAEAAGCDLVAFPELSTTGYPPGLRAEARLRGRQPHCVVQHGRAQGRCAAVVGFVDQDADLYNAAAVCANGEIVGTYRKRLLPNTTVFDEARYFTPGRRFRTRSNCSSSPGSRSSRSARTSETVRPSRRAGCRRRRGEHQHQCLTVTTPARAPNERMLATVPSSHTAIVYVDPVGGPGRVGVRQRVHRVRPRRHAAGQDAAVRREPDDRRRTEVPVSTEAAAIPHGGVHRGVVADGRRHDRAGRARRRCRRPCMPSMPTASCTARWCWAPVTTARRMASTMS